MDQSDHVEVRVIMWGGGGEGYHILTLRTHTTSGHCGSRVWWF